MSCSTHNRSFQRRVFPGNRLQLLYDNSKQTRETEKVGYTKNAKKQSKQTGTSSAKHNKTHKIPLTKPKSAVHSS